MIQSDNSGAVEQGAVIRVDGSRPASAAVAAVNALCDRMEDGGASGPAVVRLTGAPEADWTRGLTVAAVNTWERALRRFERLDAPTLAVATGECGGAALELLLATDYRIANSTLRLVLPADPGGVWPGMALYRMANQVGVARTRRAVMRATAISALDALELHLIDEVVQDAEAGLAEAVRMVVVGAGHGAGAALRRQLILDAATTSFENALGSHLAACDRALRREPVEAAS